MTLILFIYIYVNISDSFVINFRRKFYDRKIYSSNPTQSFWISPIDGLNIEVFISKHDPEKIVAKADDGNGLIKIYNQLISRLFQPPVSNISAIKPPILFIHGSFHAAWCWSEHFFEYFNQRGYDCYALSLRGTSSTGLPPGSTSTSIKVEEHVVDLSYALQTLQELYPQSPAPVLISHSFGGLITMKLLEKAKNRSNVSAVALLCSVPPSGNGRMTSRYLQTRFLDAFRILWGLALKGATLDARTCRALFFDDKISSEDVNRYMRNFQADSRVGLDLVALASVLPSISTNATGQATWLSDSPNSDFPILVAGASLDAIVDEAGVAETGAYFGVQPVMLPLPHDIMLCTDWKIAAEAVGEWLSSSVVGRVAPQSS